MGKINSRSKGSKYERTIAKWFEQWTSYEFGRVPGSGSLRWKKTDNITSDIICTDDKHSRRFPLSIECKCYKDINFEHLLLGNKSCKITQFWEQATRDAKRGKKVPILFMRYNSMPSKQNFVVVQPSVFNILKKHSKNSLSTFKVKTSKIDVVILLATEILEIDYKTIYIEIRKLNKKQ